MPNIVINLKPGAIPVRQRQYLVQQDTHLGIQGHIEHLKEVGILVEVNLLGTLHYCQLGSPEEITSQCKISVP